MASITVDVDVDIAEFCDEDIIREIKERGLSSTALGSPFDQLDALHYPAWLISTLREYEQCPWLITAEIMAATGGRGIDLPG